MPAMWNRPGVRQQIAFYTRPEHTAAQRREKISSSLSAKDSEARRELLLEAQNDNLASEALPPDRPEGDMSLKCR